MKAYMMNSRVRPLDMTILFLLFESTAQFHASFNIFIIVSQDLPRSGLFSAFVFRTTLDFN